MERILVFGVSGVGKTTACVDYVARHPNYLLLRASTLIAEATGATLKSLQTASAQELLANQTILQSSVEDRLQSSGASNFILDGQCVLDNGNEIVILSTDTIAAFRPTGLILLESSAPDIVTRRSQDGRQRPFRDSNEISRQIQMNREAVNGYAKELGIPFVIAEAKGALGLDEPIEMLTRSL